MEENEFWLGLWKIVGVTVCVVTATIAGCNAHQTLTIQEMVAKGADPILAACGVAGERQTICALAVTKQKQ